MCVLFAHVIADAKENYCQIEALEDISRIKFLLLQTVKKKKKSLTKRYYSAFTPFTPKEYEKIIFFLMKGER